LSKKDMPSFLQKVSDAPSLSVEQSEQVDMPQDSVRKAMDNLNRSMSEQEQRESIHFAEFLGELTAEPTSVMRNIFQMLHDMIHSYVGEGLDDLDEYPDDPESISYVCYDCSKLFIEGADRPFFADRLFANRLINLVESMKRGAQQNKIYIFKGPHGCGKSTFLNNMLKKFEEYANTDEGLRYETVWRLDRKCMGDYVDNQTMPILESLLQLQDLPNRVPILESLLQLQDLPNRDQLEIIKAQSELHATGEYIEVPCPSHDNPILMIPKAYRRLFFDDLFKNDEFKWKLYTEKEYEWIFKDSPCTICSSLYQALLSKLKSPQKVFEMVYARPYRFDRRLGEGISVYNPGDKPMRQNTLSNAIIQSRINGFLRDSNQVKYVFSQYAKSNNGIYALMDIKSHNTERLIELHK
jgi:hypothetical protein